MSEASKGTSEIQNHIVSVLDAAKETGAAANEVLSAAGELSRNGEELASQMDRFLQEIRAA